MINTTKTQAKNTDVVLGFNCPKDLRRLIDRFAIETDSSRSQVIRLAIRTGLKKLVPSRDRR
jgi:metal-responsive CopG/Arc/MetJ family transcriptional regulator